MPICSVQSQKSNISKKQMRKHSVVLVQIACCICLVLLCLQTSNSRKQLVYYTCFAFNIKLQEQCMSVPKGVEIQQALGSAQELHPQAPVPKATSCAKGAGLQFSLEEKPLNQANFYCPQSSGRLMFTPHGLKQCTLSQPRLVFVTSSHKILMREHVSPSNNGYNPHNRVTCKCFS